jgi:hypothetical protein
VLIPTYTQQHVRLYFSGRGNLRVSLGFGGSDGSADSTNTITAKCQPSSVPRVSELESEYWEFTRTRARALTPFTVNARWRPPHLSRFVFHPNPSIERSIINRYSAFHALPCQYRIPALPSRPSVVSKETRSVSVCAQPPTKHVLERENVPRGSTVLHVAHVTLGTYRLVGGCARVSGCARPTARDPSRRTNEAWKARDTVGILTVVTTNYPWSIDKPRYYRGGGLGTASHRKNDQIARTVRYYYQSSAVLVWMDHNSTTLLVFGSL